LNLKYLVKSKYIFSSDGVSCPSGYIYNPHSSTCYKIVTLSKKWDDAKAYCEGNGDRLAVFDSLESISWARQMRKNHSGKLL